jgi:hypothetical protein
LLDLPVIVKYVTLKRLQWARPIVHMDNTSIPTTNSRMGSLIEEDL